jgi:hypothetical protein
MHAGDALRDRHRPALDWLSSVAERRSTPRAVIARLFLDRAIQYSRAPKGQRSSAILGHPLTGAARCADRRRVVTVYCGVTPCAQFTPETANPRGNTDPNADSSHFPITRFHIHIDRVSLSQHGTALLISAAIPTLIGH